MSSISSQIQEVLDDKKEDMPDGVYKALCDTLMDINKQEQIFDDKKIFRIKYIYPTIMHVREDCIRIGAATATQFVQLTHKEYKTIYNYVQETGQCHVNPCAGDIPLNLGAVIEDGSICVSSDTDRDCDCECGNRVGVCIIKDATIISISKVK